MLIFDITASLDGFVAGPNPSLDDPLGRGGEPLHDWVTSTRAWRERHGMEGGEENPASELVAEGIARQGAVIMGRRMFSGGSGPWEHDPNREGWWGDDPPFRNPVFVLTHHAREPVTKDNGTTYTDVLVAGGAEAIQQYLAAGLIDEFEVHVAPILLVGGTPLFGDLGANTPRVELTRAVSSAGAAHLRYRVLK